MRVQPATPNPVIASDLTTMEHLSKFVIPSPQLGLKRVLTATNAALSKMGEKVTISACNHQVAVLDDQIGSGEKLLEAALAVAIRDKTDYRYMVSFDLDTREREVNDADPFGQEMSDPQTPYEKYCEAINQKVDQQGNWEQVPIDDITDPDTGEVSLPADKHLEVVGVENVDIPPLAAKAFEVGAALKIGLSPSAFKRNRTLLLLADIPHTIQGSYALINFGAKRDLGSLAPGPEDKEALCGLVESLEKMIEENHLIVDKQKLMQLAMEEPSKGAFNPPATTFASQPSSSAVKSQVEVLNSWMSAGPLPPLSSETIGMLKKILDAGAMSRSALGPLGLDPEMMSQQLKRHHYGELLSSKNALPPKVKSELKSVLDDDNFFNQSYQVTLQKMVVAVSRALVAINQNRHRPILEHVALLHLARSPNVHHFHNGYRTLDNGDFMPSI